EFRRVLFRSRFQMEQPCFFQLDFVLGRGANARASQYTFIARIKPTSNASQLSPATSLDADASMASVRAILTISHTRNPTAAVPALSDANLPVSPRANTAAGITTDRAPYATDHPTFCFPVSTQATSAATTPTPACPATTHQGDSAGFCSRTRFACSAVSGGIVEASSVPSGSG